jgi:hypothetical protein
MLVDAKNGIVALNKGPDRGLKVSRPMSGLPQTVLNVKILLHIVEIRVHFGLPGF